jgi:multidrug efflux pump subunit AcrA (membrane-fusion protein)
VQPAVFLNAKSEVSGKITYRHPGLKQGGSLPAGTVVLKIEPTIFEFSLNQSEASLASSRSSLVQLEAEEKSTQKLLAIAQENLHVGQKELDRLKALWDKKLVALSSLDAEKQKMLGLQQQVADLQGKVSTYASRKAATSAQIRQSETQVDEKKDTLGRTTISLPFDARIGAVNVETDEFVSAGSQLFEASGIQSVEIDAQLPVKLFRPLAGTINQQTPDLQNPSSLQKILDSWDLEASVRLVGDSSTTSDTAWKARLVRIGESVDPLRDTLSLVVSVDNPYGGVVPGKQPPLLKGMYTSVEFMSKPTMRMVIPRSALHQGRVYVATAENKLAIRPITISFEQGRIAIVEAGLEEGEQLIITDVVPVIEGLPVKPVQATTFEEELRILASGKS